LTQDLSHLELYWCKNGTLYGAHIRYALFEMLDWKKAKFMSHTGTIKWFSNAKGFGFIIPDDGGGDIFAHYSAISMDGYKTLSAGQAVSYSKECGDKGVVATSISAVSEIDP